MNRFAAALVSMTVAVGLSVACSTPDAQVPLTPSTLQAPAEGQGFQFRTPLFSINPGDEVQDCYFYKMSDLAKTGGLPVDQAVNLHRIELAQRAGSHHMNLFRVKTIVGLDPANGAFQHGINGTGECFKSSNWSDWPLIANTQQEGNLDWSFPDGVANVFQPDEWLMLQTHYVNAGSQKTPEGGEVAINFHTIPADQVKSEIGTLFATTQSIRICKSNPTPTFTHTCNFKNTEPVNVIGANGHFHARGRAFDIFSTDGTTVGTPPDSARFYESLKWDEPPMLHSPELNLQLPAGSSVFYSCAFQWQPPPDDAGGCAALDAADQVKNPDKTPDCCYTFGPIVEKNEHCNAFVYYWPKEAVVGDITCE